MQRSTTTRRMRLARGRAPRVLILAPKYPPAFRGGGPIRTLTALVDAAPASFDVRVMTADRDLGSSERLPVPSNRWTDATPPRPVWYMSADRPRAVARALRAAADWEPDLVYCNGYFDPVFSIAVRAWFRVRGTPLLIAPRGEFSAAALAIKPRKKRLLRIAARLTGLDAGATWHASSSREADDIRAEVGPRARVVVRENDSLLPRTATPPPERGDIPDTEARLVFVSRLVENKGLHILLEALRGVRSPFSLDVYGIEEQPEYVDRCRALAEHPGLAGRVRFRGPLAPAEVRSTLARYDLFPFPTSTENFGNVIAEALSVSCPVMLADTTPWTARIAAGGGVPVDGLAPDDWAMPLQRFLELPPDARRARRLAAGAAFDRWRAEASAPHVLELVFRDLA